MEEIIVEVWGDFACFSKPESKVERLTYPFPTPSAARGILSAIYMKPKEFYWQINRIEVLSPIRYISFRRNEVQSVINGKKYLIAEEERTQRQTVALKDVRYRIAASIVLKPGFSGSAKQLYEQARRRIRAGKCFMQPALGMREFAAYFEEYIPCEGERQPIPETLDAGLMVYDVFDFVRDDGIPKKKTKPRLALFHAVMENGIITVPPYDSDMVLKGGAPC